MATRDNPYGAFNFIVKLGDVGGEDQIVGGFSDVSGLGNEVKYSEYRNGNDKENHVRKVAEHQHHRRRHAQARRDRRPAAVHLAQGHPRGRRTSPRTVTITLLDEAPPDGVQLGAAGRPAQEVGRPDAGRQGRRRGRDGGAAPRRRADRLQVA